MDVSVIIVNYNTKSLLKDCLRSIFTHTHNCKYEIIVVDNASTDNSQEDITSEFPSVRWIQSNRNLGFGGGNNLGVKEAQGKYILLLNPDTILLNDAISGFYTFAENDAEHNRTIYGGYLMDQEKNIVESSVTYPSPSYEIRYLTNRLFGNSFAKYNSSTVTKCDAVSGADMFLLKKLYDSVEGFDENYFLYYEETDLQLRLTRKGNICCLIPGPKIIHLEGGSFSKKGLTPRRFIFSQTSYNYYINKNFSSLYGLYFHIVMIFIRLTVFFQKEWSLKEKLNCYKTVLKFY